MPKMKKWKSGRSNLIKIALLFLLAAAAIIAVRLRDAEPRYILPEERAIREERRTSPDNAYPILLEAARMLPENRSTATRRRASGRRGRLVAFKAQLDSTGQLLHTDLPDDDPEFMDFVQRAAPALEKAREALDKPYFVCEMLTPNEHKAVVARCTDLARHFLTQASFAADKDNKPMEAAGRLVEALKVIRLIAQDDSYAWDIESLVLRRVIVMARSTTSAASLDFLLESLTTVGRPFPDPESPIKMLWREIDRNLEMETFPRNDPFSARLKHWFMQENVDKIVANKEEVYRLARTPLAKISSQRRRGVAESFRTEINTIRTASKLNAEYHAATLVLALERYNADNNAYPQKLAELAPKYIPEIPKDPITDGSFIYRRTDTDYLLYSQGENGKDDDASANQDIVYVGKQSNQESPSEKSGAGRRSRPF
jgi:hypothetical protein